MVQEETMLVSIHSIASAAAFGLYAAGIFSVLTLLQ